jgi:4-hydroxy-tetrahydrodipicolinate synthase
MTIATRLDRPTGLDAEALLRGVSPVLLTPFTDDGAIDVESFRRVIRYALGTGVTSVMYPGFAGEFYKLSDEERLVLTEVLIEEVHRVPGVAAIVAVQDHATRLAAERSRRWVELGADAINLLPPYLLDPPVTAIESHIRAVLGAVPDTPVIVQYAPGETGTSLSIDSLAAIARDHANLALVKVESSPPGPYIEELGRLEPPILAFEGYAGVQLPDAFRRGAVGTQPGCSFTEIYVEIWRRFASGDAAGGDLLHSRLLPYTSYWMLSTETINAAEKLISYRRGLISSPLCREPAHLLDGQELAAIDRFLAEFADLLPSLADVGRTPDGAA